MPPRQQNEETSLLPRGSDTKEANPNDENKQSMEVIAYQNQSSSLSTTDRDYFNSSWSRPFSTKILIITLTVALVLFGKHTLNYIQARCGMLVPTGPYRLIEAQEGSKFFDSYEFYDGPDSLGSAGHNTYVSKARAEELNIVSIVSESNPITNQKEEFVYMSSSPSDKGPRNSVRLEGKMRFNRGLFLLDVRHMPDGCGVWPAFWLTDEAHWPRNGEVDILEGG